MIPGGDLTVMELCRIELSDVRGSAVTDRKLQHLVEIAIVKCAVPAY